MKDKNNCHEVDSSHYICDYHDHADDKELDMFCKHIAWSRHHYTKYSDNKIEISMHTDILIKQFKRYTCSCSSYLAWVIRSAVMGLSSCKHPTQNIFHSYYKQTINGYAYVTF